MQWSVKLQQISSRKQLYGKKVIDLTEEEKQTISERFQLASGLAVAACCGDFDDVCAAIKSSKNAVENNALSKALGKEKKQLKASLPLKKGDEKQAALARIAEINQIDKNDDVVTPHSESISC